MFSNLVKILGVVFLSASILSGCGELPRPYKTRSLSQKIDNPILAQRDNRVVYVAPVQGTQAQSGAHLAELVSQKLHDWDILATTRAATKDAYRLVGAGQYSAGQLHYRWTLQAADGHVVEQGAFSLPSSSTAWSLGRPSLLQTLADRTAADISAALKPVRLDAVAKADAVAGAQVAMGEITGAPGDGNRALIRSLRRLLKKAKVPMTTDRAAASMIVGGEVTVSSAGAEADQVTLTWIMRRPDGSELAKIQQRNRVPKGSLDGRWGDAAYYAANAVLASVVEVHSIVAANDLERRKPQS